VENRRQTSNIVFTTKGKEGKIQKNEIQALTDRFVNSRKKKGGKKKGKKGGKRKGKENIVVREGKRGRKKKKPREQE